MKRGHLSRFTLGPLLMSAMLFAIATVLPPLASVASPPEGRISFSESAALSSCDATRDGVIDARDVSILKLYWKGFPQPEIDCSRDGYINSRDLAILMGDWTEAVPALDAGAVPSGPDLYSPTGFSIALPSDHATGTRPVGGRFTALLMLSGGGLNIGAGEAVLTYNADRVAVRSIRTAPGIWTMWAERPNPPYGSRLVFAGGRPRGYSGFRGVIAYIEFVTIASGDEGLQILDDSRAYQAEPAGTSIPLKNGNAKLDGLYDGTAPVQAPADTRVTALQPLLAPSPMGPVWIVDLSPLASAGSIPAYEIEDGLSRSVQYEDIYALRDASLGGRPLTIHTLADGGVQSVRMPVSVPGQQVTKSEGWRRFGLWILFELGAALFLAWFLIRRHGRL